MKEYPEDIPWGEFMKKLAVLLGIAAVYVAVQLWISWPSIKWLMGGAK